MLLSYSLPLVFYCIGLVRKARLINLQHPRSSYLIVLYIFELLFPENSERLKLDFFHLIDENQAAPSLLSFELTLIWF